MKEQELNVFIQCIKSYFSEFDDADQLEFRPPIILSGSGAKSVSQYVLSYTATISVSGSFSGAIYVTLDKESLGALVELILGSEDVTHEDMVDMAGEIVNTISGNARKELGANFNISVPFVISGPTINIDLPKLVAPVYILPCKWRERIFYVFVGLDLIR